MVSESRGEVIGFTNWEAFRVTRRVKLWERGRPCGSGGKGDHRTLPVGQFGLVLVTTVYYSIVTGRVVPASVAPPTGPMMIKRPRDIDVRRNIGETNTR